MQTKLIRDGLLGLFILAAVSIAGIGIFWVRGNRFTKNGFGFMVQFPNADGLEMGASVRYRGVPVGKVQALEPKPNGVTVTIAISAPNLVIPKNSRIQTLQSGILSNTIIQIVPEGDFKEEPSLNPLSPDCDGTKIICQGATIVGTPGTSFTALLIEASTLLKKVNEEKILENLGKTLQSTDRAAKSIETLSGTANGVIAQVEAPLEKFGQTADSFSKTAESISEAAKRVGETAKGADALILENKDRIAQTLDSISGTAKETQKLIAGARPLLEDGQFIGNLQKLSENAAQTAANLRKLSETANDPTTVTTLRETLDAARATFANTQKITTDLNELTGDPRFRSDLRRLVNGLSGLVSSGNTLFPAGTAVATTETVPAKQP